ncbi:hypothetical protein EV363DRAFT_1167689, partial [Boletus edulis]
TSNEHDHQLASALHDGGQQKTIEEYGWRNLNHYGPCLIMTNATLDRIVDCLHYNKITSPQPLLLRETGWSKSKRFAGEVIAISGYAGCQIWARVTNGMWCA